MSETQARPDVIYLQGFCDECGDPPVGVEVTWCVDDIGCEQCGGGDLRYVRQQSSEGVVVRVTGAHGYYREDRKYAVEVLSETMVYPGEYRLIGPIEGEG